ncbi:MAG: DUF1801 domain-containing protein [bacterium]|nr:DUF1801 domain-containing protein [bacterium]
MAELKTKKNSASVIAFLKSLHDEQKSKDSLELNRVYTQITGKKATMWGTAIVGYDMYHYQSTRSAQKGDWPLAAFSPRVQSLTLYILYGPIKNSPLLKKLGKYKASGGCLHIKRLSDVDLTVLKQMIKASYLWSKKTYGTK